MTLIKEEPRGIFETSDLGCNKDLIFTKYKFGNYIIEVR